MSATVPILMYHSVDEHCAPAYRRWCVSPERFAEHLAVLRDRGCMPLTISELVGRLQSNSLPDNAVAITFDDGLADFDRHALPLLERFGFASTLFVTTGYVGETARWLADLGEGDRPMLSWEEIAGLARRNVEVGAHTHSHPQLDLLDPADARREIELSKALLEMHTGRPVRSFAYPHGYSTPAVRNFVARAGFTAACRVADGLSARGESPYALSRVIVSGEWTASRIDDLLEGRFAPIAPAPDRPAMKAWRLYRRARSVFRGRGSRAPIAMPDIQNSRRQQQ
jgi:peptidoglycan/xylan/chitin deacetylase (PgdA/CDA1 family)